MLGSQHYRHSPRAICEASGSHLASVVSIFDEARPPTTHCARRSRERERLPVRDQLMDPEIEDSLINGEEIASSEGARRRRLRRCCLRRPSWHKRRDARRARRGCPRRVGCVNGSPAASSSMRRGLNPLIFSSCGGGASTARSSFAGVGYSSSARLEEIDLGVAILRARATAPRISRRGTMQSPKFRSCREAQTFARAAPSAALIRLGDGVDGVSYRSANPHREQRDGVRQWSRDRRQPTRVFRNVHGTSSRVTFAVGARGDNAHTAKVLERHGTPLWGRRRPMRF